MNLPADVQNIISVLESNGHEAYAVGGCVRDCILGKVPHDWDITTSALPEQVKALFERTFDTGIEHGTVTVLMHGVGYEVTTYRVDGKYEDGRHPKEVTFTASLEEDLKRRDFTINAMAYNDIRGLVDLFGGEEDLEAGIIRAVGNPTERFTEDALRMLRALRFSAQLGFEIEQGTYDAIKTLAPTLGKISAERIQVEMVKLVTSAHPERIRDVYATGLTKIFFPEFDDMMECQQVNKHHMYSVGEHTIVSMGLAPDDKVIRLTMMLHDIAKPVCKTTDENGQNHFKMHPVKGAEMARTVLRRLKFDNDTTDKVCNLVKNHDDRPEINPRNVRRMIIRVGQENFNDLLAVKRADCLAQSMYHREEKLSYIDELEKVFNEVVAAGDCLRIKDLQINGKDLIAMGVPQGQRIGAVLSTIFDAVVENPELNQRETLLNMVKSMIK
ncbi:tRNA nucleotidyltransferase (CCA-adding enzyme) [Pseudobutyrivibrio xylanivorans DSM 14809]|uniref:tRNA nucleotidyltransferase (CCA-adding enzyme) n=2 Tax=Pseudobutyrivibrio xylanivorans TaxID=185007 RepID=A0A1M6DED5_PSEXY|nr:CCA tRNA nucleotidyltransferase [Pseudobutyrivibrio xylanivorans]SHI71563.1 tRNA nucleotidyltransferase (CCA-adding enzyme) [Pseudobutyrivibrio xylanivorans DSM 14809]